MVNKIISGGQTGVDEAALVVAKKNGIETGGTAPMGFITELGPKKEYLESFGLVEGPFDEKKYIKRTMLNVDNSDGTLVLMPISSVGTKMTIGYAQQQKWTQGYLNHSDNGNIKTSYKPVFVIKSFSKPNIKGAIEWIKNNNIKTLNIAGPRSSHNENIYPKSCEIIQLILNDLRQQKINF